MFTGIVTDIGTVERAEETGDLRLRIRTGQPLESVALGASIACSGVCLTVIDHGPDWFDVELSAETLARTAPDRWRPGSRLNLERALRLGEELGGHIVTGHVDGIATVTGLAAVGDSTRAEFRVDPALAPFVAPKGSVTIDGVSLTVNEVADHGGETRFAINLIPHTQAVTTLGALASGQQVHVEIDVLARYLQRMRSYASPM